MDLKNCEVCGEEMESAVCVNCSDVDGMVSDIMANSSEAYELVNNYFAALDEIAALKKQLKEKEGK